MHQPMTTLRTTVRASDGQHLRVRLAPNRVPPCGGEADRGRMRQDKIQGLVPPDLDSCNGDLGMGCRNLFLEISMLSGCLRVRYPKLMCRCGHYRGQTAWTSFQTCCSDMSRPVSQNHTCLRPQAPRDLFSCGVRPPGFYGDKILGLTLPCMSNLYEAAAPR